MPRRIAQHTPLIVLSLVICGSTLVHGQDFNPRGRSKPPAGSSLPRRRAPVPPTTNTEGSTEQGAASTTVLIERYIRIVLQQPGEPFPLQRLTQLCRERDGDLKALITDFETRSAASTADAYGATVGLAGLYKANGQIQASITAYEKAVEAKPNSPAGILALARTYQDQGERGEARRWHARALPVLAMMADKEQTLSSLLRLALDDRDWDDAKKIHAQWIKLQPNSLFIRGMLGRELYTLGEYKRAEVEFKALVVAAAGDNRALAPALTDLGRAQAKANEHQEALATLQKARAAAGAELAVRQSIDEAVAEIYRADQQLPALVKLLEDDHPRDFARLSFLAGLYEEVGDPARALTTYRKALAVNPRNLDLRLKLIRLLQSQGELDQAVAEYEMLIAAAPHNAQFVFEQCEVLIRRGDRARALRLLNELEGRVASDEDSLNRVAEFYGRLGETTRSLRVLERLAHVAPTDPSHLIDLGDRYFQDGNHPLAVQTWKRILVSVSPRARALSAIGDVYLEHDMMAEGLEALKEAVQLEPANDGYRKLLANAYERTHDYREARLLWEGLSARARSTRDKTLLREARSHIVSLWGFEKLLELQIAPLRLLFAQTPADVEAGRILADVLYHLQKMPEAEVILRRVIELEPGDPEGYLSLERVLIQAGKPGDAIGVLEKWVQIEPKRARDLYQRMAQYALQAYQDEDAIRYAAKAVELNPDDAEGHRKLAEMYRSRQDFPRAITEFRQAIAKNDRLYVVYFELADLVLAKGETDEADRLFRRVVRGAPDEELVARAARLSMQINLGRGTLESLEHDLLPLAINNPNRTVYRRLLVEIYANLTFGLVQRVRHGSRDAATTARAALARIGARAVKPLLDALAEGDIGQQRVAIDVLGYVENKNASKLLFAFATGQASLDLRARAMVACGALRDPDLLPKYNAWLRPGSVDGLQNGMPSDPVAVAAVWGLARMNDRRVVSMLRNVIREGTPEMRALGTLGLAYNRDQPSIRDIAALAGSSDSADVVRAASAFALGTMGTEREVPTLLSLAVGDDPLARQAALLALARRGVGKTDTPESKRALRAMADAVFAAVDSESVRARILSEGIVRAGSAALVLLGEQSDKPAADMRDEDVWVVPEGALDVDALVKGQVPREVPLKARALAFARFSEAIHDAAAAALETSRDRAMAVLDALSPTEGPFDFSVIRRLESSLLPLVHHPEPAVRMKAIVVVSRLSTPAAVVAVLDALNDTDEAVQRVALASIGGRAGAPAAAPLAHVLAHHDRWAMRALAAEGLGRLGAAGLGSATTSALRTAATTDAYAFVREAALRALATYDGTKAGEVAQWVSANDPEPKVRETAKQVMRGASP